MEFPKIYNVYIKENSPNPKETAEFVAEGFNIYAAFLTLFWALYKRVWWLAILFPIYNSTLVYLFEQGLMNEAGGGVLQMGLAVFAGFSGNDWFAKNLEKKGYKLSRIIAAKNLLEAQQRFFGEYKIEMRIPQKSVYATL